MAIAALAVSGHRAHHIVSTGADVVQRVSGSSDRIEPAAAVSKTN